MRGRRPLSLIAGTVLLGVGLVALAVATVGLPDKRAAGPATDALVDQDGRPFTIAQTSGKTTVLSFMFSHCPSVCPLQTRDLLRVQSSLPASIRSKVEFVSVSVDPERDTPATLKEFAERLGIDLETWTFVTGSGVAELAARYDVDVTRDDTGSIDHRAVVFLIDAKGRLAQTYSGSPVDRTRLAREVEILTKLVPPDAVARLARAEEGF